MKISQFRENYEFRGILISWFEQKYGFRFVAFNFAVQRKKKTKIPCMSRRNCVFLVTEIIKLSRCLEENF